MARKKRAPGEPVIIKKYANRRLYNTETSSYVTLDFLADLIKAGENLQVLDAKSGDDLTHTVLTQIIFEREARANTLLPLPFLQQLIGFYGDGMAAMIPAYLKGTMEILNRHKQQLHQTFGDIDPENFMPLLEELIRQNMAFFEQTMQTVVGSNENPVSTKSTDKPKKTSQPSTNANNRSDEITALRQQLADLKDKVDQLTG